MGEWIEYELGDLANEITVGFVGTMANEYVNSGIPFLRSLNIKPYKIDFSQCKFITPEFNKQISKSVLHPGDVVIVRTGAPGTCAIIPDEIPIANCSDLVIVRPSDRLDNRYLVYFINSLGFAQISINLA